ncbi:MAG: hypothetical protein GX369_06250 [Euryarchaeota archaeon]|nr:hypothetical protein [Euryarchaeota archaeon]
MRKVIISRSVPLLLLAAAVSSFFRQPDWNIYWPMIGMWALILVTIVPRRLGNMPFTTIGIIVMLITPHMAPSIAPDLQFIILPVLVFILSYLTLSVRDIGARDLIPELSALLASAFVGLSALAYFYIDQMVGSTLISSNEEFMLHLISGLIGIAMMTLLSHFMMRAMMIKGDST